MDEFCKSAGYSSQEGCSTVVVKEAIMLGHRHPSRSDAALPLIGSLSKKISTVLIRSFWRGHACCNLPSRTLFPTARLSPTHTMPFPCHTTPVCRMRYTTITSAPLGGVRLPPVWTSSPVASRRHRGRKRRLAHAGTFALDVPPRPKLASYRSLPQGRPWPPTTPCFKCFRRFKLMFQVFHLNVAKI
jgi:hypothetical protein